MINLTCSGKSQALEMAVLEFLLKLNGDPKGKQVPDWSNMELPLLLSSFPGI